MDIQELIEKLSDSDDSVRMNAAEALTFNYLNKGNSDEIEKLLGNEDAYVRKSVAKVLRRAAEKGWNITPAVPALVKALKDRDKYVRKNAAEALRKAADNGEDITPAVPALANALGDKNGNVRYYAAMALWDAAWKERDITPAVPALANALGDENKDVRDNAAGALRMAAGNGQDITPAVPALAKALKDKNKDVKEKAAQALTYHYLNKGNFAEIEKLLGNKDAYVRKSAAGALDKATLKGQDITPAVPALINALGDKNGNVRVNAAGALRDAAKNGQDITPAVPALANALGDEDVKENAAGALEQAALEGQDITLAVSALAEALKDEDADVRKYAETLTYHYLNKRNSDEIEKLLENEDAYVRKSAAGALRRAAKRGEDITLAVPALINALGDKNKDVRENAAGALENFALNCNTIEKLDKIQQVIEESFNAEKMAEERIKVAVAQLVKKIAQKKAELSKEMDGEMLDVRIKRPKGGQAGKKGVYQAMRKREVF